MVATRPEILLHAGADEVADAMAARLMARLTEIQRDFRVPQLALTGGRIATRAYQKLANDGPNSAVDWSRIELWWGDERFVPADHADRNAKQALDLLAAPLALNPDRIHEMPASDGGLDLDQAAEAYARELGEVSFDIRLLGMGLADVAEIVLMITPAGHEAAPALRQTRHASGSCITCARRAKEHSRRHVAAPVARRKR